MSLPVPDRVVVINLKRRPDRLDQFHAAWEASEWGKVLPQPQVFTAIDGKNAKRVPPALSKHRGVFGCWRSHVEVLSEALDEGAATVAVFEDDAIPVPGSAGRLARALRGLPSIAAGLWLDAHLLGPGNRVLHGPFGTGRLLRAPLRTHGYVMTRPLMEAALGVLEVQPGHVDHLLATARFELPIYATTPSLVSQSGASSDTGSRWDRFPAASLPESGRDHRGQRSKRSR